MRGWLLEAQMTANHHLNIGTIFKTKLIWPVLGILAVGGYFVITKHMEHVLRLLPFLFILLCPLMHVFMHRHHGGMHGNHGGMYDEGGGKFLRGPDDD
jgi:hypothetical protein